MAAKNTVEILKNISKAISSGSGFGSVLKNIKIVGGSTGHCLAEFVVQKEYLNYMGKLHGGFTATIVDNYAAYALMTHGIQEGLTVNLHVSYLRGAVEGDTIVVDAKAVKRGNRLAYLECELRNKNDDSIIAKGRQTHFIIK